MINKIDNQVNVWLGEGDVGIGVTLGDDGKACGIGFIQLKENYEIGTDSKDDARVEEGNSVNIMFVNRNGIESLNEGLSRFLKTVAREEGERK